MALSFDGEHKTFEAELIPKPHATGLRELYDARCGASVCTARLGVVELFTLGFNKTYAFTMVSTASRPEVGDWYFSTPLEPVMGDEDGVRKYRPLSRGRRSLDAPRRKAPSRVGTFAKLEGRESLGSYPVLPVIVECRECGRPSLVNPPRERHETNPFAALDKANRLIKGEGA